jgi:hypothetical protein
VQEFSSVGRASVSKTEGRGFESPNSCHFLGIIKQTHHGLKIRIFLPIFALMLHSRVRGCEESEFA